ncbi:type II toxin-antitoxin system PemK/MazF family toxin [Clostridium botulinum]|nr:type II toxin-antitoxin system PemK/MazF family toxin [Clostridium botulinum]EKS4395838.1 type II toxin-antitoxin system PemK/MazF family toxin [Clostridium botulinum]
MLNNKIFMKRRGDIAYVDLGNPKGTNQGGKRPCIIVPNNKCNSNSTSIQIIPITSNLNKKNLPTHIFIKKDELNGLDKDSLILVEQTDLISTSQILNIVGRASDEIMRKVNAKLKIQFDLDKPDINRIRTKIKTLKEMEHYILRHNENSAELLNILKFQASDFKDYCEEYNVDCSQYYVSKFNIINRYLQRNIAA